MSGDLVDVLLDELGPRATQQLGLLLAVAVRDASYDVYPAVRAFVRDLRAWSLVSTQQEVARVFRDTPSGVPALASAVVGEEPCSHDVVDIAEAVRRTGLSDGLLRRHCRRGRHGAAKATDGAWRLDARAVDALAAQVHGERAVRDLSARR